MQGKQCKLVVEGEDKKIVAHATLIEVQVDNPTVHGIPLGKDNLRVSIYASFNDDALLPIPVRGELETVGQAKGSVVAWPKQFVLPMEENKKGIKVLWSTVLILAIFDVIYEILHLTYF